MDVAGPLASCGLSTWVVVCVEGRLAGQLAEADVVSINADTRHLSSEKAAKRVRGVVHELVHPDTEILIKKIDSTLRGNVVAETVAMLQESGRRTAVVAPAFPRQGRTVIEGVVNVHGVPLRETHFARDALSPPPLQPLPVLFRSAEDDADVHLVERGTSVALTSSERRQIFVVDSASDEDLRATVGSLCGGLKDVLLVGSAGIAEALADACFQRARRALVPPMVAGPLLFVVGSRAEPSEQQTRALVEAGSARIVAAPNGLVDVDAALRLTEPVLVLKATPDVGGSSGDPAEVAERMSNGVATLLQRRPIAAVVATGGDTAVAILRRLSQAKLQVVGDLLTGIPFSRIYANGRQLLFVTKAGGFGTRDTFVTIAHRLRGGA